MEELSTVIELEKQKKIHYVLRLRIVTLGILTIFFLTVVSFDVFSYRVTPWLGAPFFAGGFLVGALLLYRMTHITWDTSIKKIRSEPTSMIGIFFVVLYLVLDFVFERIIFKEFHSLFSARVALYSTLAGVMLGRTLGLLRSIHILHKETAPVQSGQIEK